MRLRAYRQILGNIGLLILSVLFTVLILEWALRFFNIQRVVALNPPVFRDRAPATISYDLRPSLNEHAFGEYVTTDARGLRTISGSKEKPVFVLLGDSVAFGWGLSDSASPGQQLQNLLPDFTVINAAVPGHNIIQQVEQYREKIAPLKPVGLMLIFVYNDFDETYAMDSDGSFYPKSKKPDAPLAERMKASINKPGTIHIPFKYFLQTHSATFGFLERMTKHSVFRGKSVPPDIFADPVTPAMLNAYRAHLHELSQLSKGVPKVFIIWPENALHIESRSELKRIAQAEGFSVLDLYEIIGNSYESLGWDSHPNAATIHKLAPLFVDALRHFAIVK